MRESMDALRAELREEKERQRDEKLQATQAEMQREFENKMRMSEKFNEFDRVKNELQAQVCLRLYVSNHSVCSIAGSAARHPPRTAAPSARPAPRPAASCAAR